jgi:hypothetical protein
MQLLKIMQAHHRSKFSPLSHHKIATQKKIITMPIKSQQCLSNRLLAASSKKNLSLDSSREFE